MSDGSLLVSGSRDSSLRLWDTITGTLLRTARTPNNPITHLRFVRPGDHLFVQTGEDCETRCARTRHSPLCTHYYFEHVRVHVHQYMLLRRSARTQLSRSYSEVTAPTHPIIQFRNEWAAALKLLAERRTLNERKSALFENS